MKIFIPLVFSCLFLTNSAYSQSSIPAYKMSCAMSYYYEDSSEKGEVKEMEVPEMPIEDGIIVSDGNLPILRFELNGYSAGLLVSRFFTRLFIKNQNNKKVAEMMIPAGLSLPNVRFSSSFSVVYPTKNGEEVAFGCFKDFDYPVGL